MHPACSVIFFTTASGTGYGILAILSVMVGLGLVPEDRALGIVGLGIAFALVSSGLLSSTFHLGHPERAWRALTQWRSSWLSREGVLAILTYGPWALLTYAWIIRGDVSGVWTGVALLTAAMAAITVFATAMIYRSLATVHQWHNGWTVAGYLFLGAAGGAVWVAAIMSVTTGLPPLFAGLTAIAVIVALAVKRLYWRFIDTTAHRATPKTATGLKGDSVRLLEGPHTKENYLQQEMGYKVARKHAEKLRIIVVVAGFLIPAALMMLVYSVALSGIATAACTVAAIMISFGVVIERWLFFAEARHVVTLYYGAETA